MGSEMCIRDRLKKRLTMAGRLIVTVGDEAQPTMETFVIRRIGDSDWLEQSIFDTHIPSLMKQEKPASDSSFVF